VLAARDAVVEARRLGIGLLVAGRGHGGSVPWPLPGGCQPKARRRVGELLFDACPGLPELPGRFRGAVELPLDACPVPYRALLRAGTPFVPNRSVVMRGSQGFVDIRTSN
jgi:hypothetical protein